MHWPWQRFEVFFAAHARRSAVRQLEERRLAMVAGAWANSNMDDGKNTRTNFLRQIDEMFNNTVELIYNPRAGEIDEDDPFFSAMKVAEVPSGHEDKQVLEVLIGDADVDQE